MADTISASRGPCPLRLRRGLPPQQLVNRAESQFSTGLECFRAGLRAQDRAHLTPEVCAVTSQR